MLELRNIRHRRGDTWTLDVPRLEVPPNALVAVAGPNGAGKSTLVEVMALLRRPEAGTISYRGGNALADRRTGHALRREVVLVHQHPFLFDTSVFDNVAYGLRLRGVRAAAQSVLVGEALAELGLTAFEGRQGRALSGGEAHRVAVARALVLRPRILLLDEPTAATDPESTALVERLMTQRTWAADASVVVTTHTVQRLNLKADLHFVLDNGRVSAC